ncbi:MAG: hypothetical protein WD872_02990 [Pirellulaceae bacterium]
MTTIKVIGVYPVEAEEPLHLIEVLFYDMQSRAALDGITQEWPARERGWQVPYLEHILNASGDRVLVGWDQIGKRPEDWEGDVRVVFYFHYLSFERPLLSPFGELQVPSPEPLPPRLSNKITYIPT